jgi:hypothetical protein
MNAVNGAPAGAASPHGPRAVRTTDRWEHKMTTTLQNLQAIEGEDGVYRDGLDDHVLLVGRPPVGEYLGFIKTLAVEGETANLGQLTAEWRAANDHVRELERREAGWADNAPIGPVPESFEPLKRRILEDPMFQRSFQFVPTEIGIVELDRLVVFQKHINLAYVSELKRKIGQSPRPEAVFQLCLPFDHPHPSVKMRQTAPNAYTFISPSDDFRLLEAALLKPQQIAEYSPHGPMVAVVGLVMGYGSNFLNAIHAENRLILNNGSHRAFALRDLGITHVPCIIQRVSRRDELELVGSPDVQQNPDRYLKAARPPVLKDYFDPALRKIIPVVRKHRMARVSFGYEQGDIPAN